MGSAAYLKGELEISEGYFRQAHRKFMITGDPGQIDLPRSAISGLKEANIILQNME